MKLPLVAGAFRTLNDIAMYCNQLASAVNQGWQVEHKSNGRHDIQWTDAPFDANDFFAASGTWTVTAANVHRYQFATLGNLVLINFSVQNSTLSGGLGNELRIRIPGRHYATHEGFTGFMHISGTAGDPGAKSGKVFGRPGPVGSAGGADKLGLFHEDVGTWIASTGDVGVRGFIAIDARKY